MKTNQGGGEQLVPDTISTNCILGKFWDPPTPNAVSTLRTNWFWEFLRISEHKPHQHHNLAIANGNEAHVHDNIGLRPTVFGITKDYTSASPDTENVKPTFYHSEGALRMSDGNFDNIEN